MVVIVAKKILLSLAVVVALVKAIKEWDT